MSLLNPFFLFGALALAIPVLIHLVRREKSEIIPFSTLMFLLKVPKRAIRQQKIKNLLLMALRLLLLALLVAAFARPYVTAPSTPAAAAGQNRGIVLLLDNSYSMQYGTNFDRMKTEATKRIDAMTASDRMAIIAFDEKATLLAPPSPDKQALKAALAVLEPSSAGTRFYEAFSLADRAFSQLATPQKQLVMISDFQRAGWNRTSRESIIGNDVKTEFVNLGIENPSNVGIDSVSVDPTIFTRTYLGRVTARINNHLKDQPVTVPVSFSIDGKEAGRKTVTVPANSTSLADFTGFDLNLGYSKGVVKVEAKDPLLIDNEFSFALNRREKLNVLIVDSGKALQSIYLKQAYTSSPDLPFEVKIIPVQNLTADEISKSEVVVINDVARLSDTARTRMDEMRKTGQGQFIILGGNADIGWWNGFASLPVKLTQKIFVEKDRGATSYSVTNYDRNHGIFKPFDKGTKLVLNTAQFIAYVHVEPKPGASVLAKLEDNSPILTESSPEDRGLLVFNSTVDNKWNDLPLKPTFLPLFTEMILYLSRYSENRASYTLGEGIPIVGGVATAAAAVINPDGERVALGDLAPGQQRFFAPEKTGFHEVRVGPETRVVAVNPPSGEGNLDSMPPEDLMASVQRTQGEAQQAGFFGEDDKDDYARRQTGWWYLLLFALLAGILEIYIANRAYNKAT